MSLRVLVFVAAFCATLISAEMEPCRGTGLDFTKCFCDDAVVKCVQLDELPPAADFPGTITEYHFFGCSFANITKIEYTNAVNLLFLSNENLVNIYPDAFSDLPELRKLSLNSNPLGEIRPDMFHGLHNLTELILTNTQLQHFPAGVIKQLSSLEFLDLSGNPIAFDPDAFEDSSVEKLYLNDCALREPPVMSKSHLQKITHLELNHNDMKTLGDSSFVQYSGLEILRIEDSQVTYIHKDAFDELSDLKELYLAMNNIEDLDDDTFEPVPKLEKLDLHDNNLETLEYDVIKDLTALKSVDLSENPWQCDCAITWANEVDVPITTNLTCATPKEHEGKGVLNVTNILSCPCGYDGCDTKSSTIALAVGIPIIIICLALIAFFVFKIIQSRRARQSEKNVRYSAVYRDPTENRPPQDTRPTSEL